MSSDILNHDQLNDTERAFTKDHLLANGRGAYSASTLAGCNVGKYHGLFVILQPQIDDNCHVMVSTIDEKVVCNEKSFELATHQYPGAVHPCGHKYLSHFQGGPAPKWVYEMGDCTLEKELLMAEDEDTVLIRYTVQEAKGKVQLDLLPLLAFRNSHKLSKASIGINKKVQTVAGGIQAKLYEHYQPIYIQQSKGADFVVAPDWYYNIEYLREQSRGYEYKEDLFTPGYFSVTLKRGDKLVVSISTTECNPKSLATKFSAALKKKPSVSNEKECLEYAASQFIVKDGNDTRIKAGYYWFGTWGRDTFISLPGLLLTTGQVKEFHAVLKTALADLKNGLFPNVGTGEHASYNSVDSSLWFIWAVQQLTIHTNGHAKVWKEYGQPLREILEAYKNGTSYNIGMDADGLIHAGQPGKALTWMDAVVHGTPVTPRAGKAVDINALWYNAVCFCLVAAGQAGDTNFVAQWSEYPELIRQSFMATFWDEDKQYLADCVNNSTTDWSVRPNQVFALSMPYSPVPEHCGLSILQQIKDELLTPGGLRTLSPKDPAYIGRCEGTQEQRDAAYHQGTSWPWLLGHYAEAYINITGKVHSAELEQVAAWFKEMTGAQCLYTLPEICNGDEPHKAVGAVAQAWSVAEALRLEYMMDKRRSEEKTFQTALA